jgi:hypothetical protein
MPELRKGYRANHKGTICPFKFQEREYLTCQEGFCDECWIAKTKEHPELVGKQVKLV